MRDVQVLQEAIQDSFAAENGLPSVAADEVTDPEGDDDQLVEQFLSGASVEGHVIGKWKGEEKRKKCYRSGDPHGAEQDLRVNRIAEECFVIVERPVVNDEAIADGPETVRKHEGVR